MVAASKFEEPMRMTEAEYLAFEEQSEIKHEFVSGEVFAMTGASTQHNLICAGTSSALLVQLKGKGCKVLSDTRVKVKSKPSYRYPDITVICGAIQHFNKRTDTVSNPIVLVEVLSPSTEAIDYKQKLKEYIEIETLQEYILVSQDEPQVEHFLRQDTGKWLYTLLTGLDAVLDLPSIGCKLALADVYVQVSFDEIE